MAEKKISTILLTKNSRLNTLLSAYIEECSDFELLDNFLDISEVYNTISSLTKSLLIIDMSNYDAEFIERLASDAPYCKIVAIKESPDVDFIVKIVRAGAKEILAYPVLKTEFFDMLGRVKLFFDKDCFKPDKCKMITVFSNKGGVGKTSVAANLAHELAKITKENVVLVDLNLQFGDLTTILDINPHFDISYMIRNLNSLNKDFLLSTIEKYKQTNLYLLADSPYLKNYKNLSVTQITKLFEELKKAFSYIVVDASSGFDNKTIAALDCADLLFLITTVNLPALRNCQRALNFCQKLGYDDEKVQVIVNRYMENDEISIEEAEKFLRKNIYWKIPNNYFAMMAAINKGVFISELNESSNVARSYRELAMHVSDSVFRKNLLKKFSSDNINRLDNLFGS